MKNSIYYSVMAEVTKHCEDMILSYVNDVAYYQSRLGDDDVDEEYQKERIADAQSRAEAYKKVLEAITK